jgi:hypothetical protein
MARWQAQGQLPKASHCKNVVMAHSNFRKMRGRAILGPEIPQLE